MDYSKLNDIIKSSKNILIISHVNPDGDTLGSMCGLCSAILDIYKIVRIIENERKISFGM